MQVELVQLGRSPAQTSRVVFGSMAIGAARFDPERRLRTIHAAVDAGITSIDSAPMYDLGACEQAVGQAIRGMRRRVQILSKVGLRYDDPHGEVMFKCLDSQGRRVCVRKNSRPESVRLEVERSLERLGVETLDVVHVHTRDRLTPIEDTVGALRDLLLQGKLRAIGLASEFGPREVLKARRALGDVPLASLQLHYSPLSRACEADLLPLARARSVAVIAHSALEMGLLTGRITPSSCFGAGDFRGSTPAFHRENVRRVLSALRRGIQPAATRHGVSLATVVLAWVLARPGVSAVVVGASWPQQALANAQATQLELSAEEQLAIERAFDGVTLDPLAGAGIVRRSLGRARRIASAVRLHLTARGDRRVGRGSRAVTIARR